MIKIFEFLCDYFNCYYLKNLKKLLVFKTMNLLNYLFFYINLIKIIKSIFLYK